MERKNTNHIKKSNLILWKILILLFVVFPFLYKWGFCQTIKIAGYEVELSRETKNINLSWNVKEQEKDVEVLTITLNSSTPITPPPLKLNWSFPSHNLAGFWSVTTGYRKTISASWAPSRVSSMLARSAPVFALFGNDNKNRLNVAVSDALNTVNMSCGLMEEDGMVYCQIGFFSEKHGKVKKYEVEIRFDRRNISFSKALQEVPDWWASHTGYEPAQVPGIAKMPMYSSWYSYHQSVSSDALLKEASIARKLGFRAIIVDDGWQTLDSNRGYAYTGDWQPVRMPDMKKFVDTLHKMDMKILLWYAVPFMGEKAKGFSRFKGQYLRYWNGQGAYVLDPRYPDVREYIINIYKEAVKEWNLDGFKLDFIARFVADENTVLEAVGGRDFASVNEAADQLMTDIMAELRKVKPDIMIEFRQPYVGPLMRKYGNIFRVGDCPNVAVRNRVGMVDLRLLSGHTAIHSDMLMWHYGEPVEIAALQFLNIMFAVPQVSVRLEDISKDHFNMIAFLTKYWNENRSILLNGTFEALDPLANYPLISAQGKDKKIVAVYTDHIVPLGDGKPVKKIDIINAKTTDRIILDVQKNQGTYHYKIWNCLGNLIEEKELALSRGVHGFTVPASGIVSLSLEEK